MRKTNRNDLEAIRWLSNIKWDKGMACPHCSTGDVSGLIETRGIYQCRTPKCRKQFSVFTGTKWQGTRMTPAEFVRNTKVLLGMLDKLILDDHTFQKNESVGAADSPIEGIPIRAFVRTVGASKEYYSTAHRFLHKVKDDINAILQFRDTEEVVEWLSEPTVLNDFTKHILK